MKILIQNSNILAVGSLTETADAITSTDAVYPKHIITGWEIVEATLPADYAYGKYTFSNDVFTPKVILHSKAETAEKVESVRAIRNTLLTECDWVAIRAFETESSVSAQWATYRQSLRDVPAQAGFPWTVTYPDKP
jgi:hypothetical protein